MHTILTRHTFYKDLESEIRAAKKKIILDAYIWVYDEVGIAIAKSLLKAADNGVKIFIRKDLSASIFEHTPGRIPFFLKEEDLKNSSGFMSPGFFNKLAFYIYGKKDRPQLKENYLLKALNEHSNIIIDNCPFFNHGKLIIIDDISFVGGQCISKDYTVWKDYNIKIEDADFTQHVIQKLLSKNHTSFEKRENTFLHNIFSEKQSIYQHIKNFIDSLKAEEEVIIEMSYFGMWFFPIFKSALKRGVKIKIVASKESDTNHDTNMWFLSKLLKLNSKNLSIYLSDEMIHTKGMATLNKIIIGAANFHSANGYFKGLNEQNIYSENKKLAKMLLGYFEKDLQVSKKVDHVSELPKWSRRRAIKEIFFVWLSSYFIFFNKQKIQHFRNIANQKIEKQ